MSREASQELLRKRSERRTFDRLASSRDGHEAGQQQKKSRPCMHLAWGPAMPGGADPNETQSLLSPNYPITPTLAHRATPIEELSDAQKRSLAILEESAMRRSRSRGDASSEGPRSPASPTSPASPASPRSPASPASPTSPTSPTILQWV
eukprot:gene16199-biopygen10587